MTDDDRAPSGRDRRAPAATPDVDGRSGEKLLETGPPATVVARATALTRRAREADATRVRAERERERAELLAAHDLVARVRDDDTLVLHPDDWVVDGTVRPDRAEPDDAATVPLAGPGDPDDWSRVAAANDALVDRVADVLEDGAAGAPGGGVAGALDDRPDDPAAREAHVANVRALADFAGNHYAKRIDRLTAAELREFVDWYLPRNAWPTAEQLALVDESIALAFAAAGVPRPAYDS